MSVRTLFHVLKSSGSPARRGRRALRERTPAVRPLRLEALEERRLLAFLPAANYPASVSPQAMVTADLSGGESAPTRGAGLGGRPAGPPIRLDVVALHEFGHSLGLSHNEDPSSIMYPYYNAGYDTSNLANDSAVAALLDIYADVNTSGWNDIHDADGGVSDGDVDLTYSFVPDGVRMDRGGFSTLYATFDGLFGPDQWQSVFAGELARWAAVSGGKLSVVEVPDAGFPVNYRGEVQNDPNAGDIRIGAHRFDTAGRLLALTWFPPPNGYTLAGDANFDQDENWVLELGVEAARVGPAGGAASGDSNALTWAGTGEANAVLAWIGLSGQTRAADSTSSVLPTAAETFSPAGQEPAGRFAASAWSGADGQAEDFLVGAGTRTWQTHPEDDAFADPDLLDPAWLELLSQPQGM
jgi:hypothetical protein